MLPLLKGFEVVFWRVGDRASFFGVKPLLRGELVDDKDYHVSCRAYTLYIILI